jgi:putative transcriptional regulator
LGKRGGVRVVYFNRLAEGEIWLLVIYAKNVRGKIPATCSRLFVRQSTVTKRTSACRKTMTGNELGQKLLQSVREMKAGKAARATRIAPNEVAAARLKTGLSQAEFAEALHISAQTLQEWEQGRRQPSGAAQALIQIAFRHPEVIAERSS